MSWGNSRHVRQFASALTALVICLNSLPGLAAEAVSDADAAWTRFLEQSRPLPYPPPEWKNRKPVKSDFDNFKIAQRENYLKAANVAKDFYTRFPTHTNAPTAKLREYELLVTIVRLGDTNQQSRLEALELARLKDSSTSENERFSLRVQAVQRAASQLSESGMDAVMAEYERGVVALHRDYPQQPEVFAMLLNLAAHHQGEKARVWVREILASPATDETKEKARYLQSKLDAVGKPVEIKFTAVNSGKEVDTSKLVGRVVLVNFWATWCAPCITKLPEIKSAFAKYNGAGFEVIGISLDESKKEHAAFIELKNIPWPEYCDGQLWHNKFARQFGVTALPTMWLLDKKGHLRDLNAGTDLPGKIEKLLSE